MTKNSIFSSTLENQVLMIGFNPHGECVYSAFMSINAYDNELHPWDQAIIVKSLGLKTVHGYLFGEKGSLLSEFESEFNLETGIYTKGWSRDEIGIVTEN